MRWLALLLLCSSSVLAQDARVRVEASAPTHHAITVYRDPDRAIGERMDRDLPLGLAMITETRTVTLPKGRSTIAFEGVAEGMVAVTAIVTGLPRNAIERNRNAELLSPAALVNGMLGNRVRMTRTDPATGEPASEDAIVRTRADGGLVLETRAGFEAVRCSGLTERVSFDRVPANLSTDPIFSLDTFDPDGGTYEVELTYLAWGFDWEANYVAILGPAHEDGGFAMSLMAWLSVLNDNGQTFPDADLLAVAGTIQVDSDFEGLADVPEAQGLRLTCYPLGSTARGTVVPPPPPPPPPAAMPASAMDGEPIIVTGSRVTRQTFDAANALSELSEEAMAKEEQLGDLKLYRVPRPVTVAARSLKQVAFLDRPEVEARFVYVVRCDLFDRYDEDFDFATDEPVEDTRILLVTKNEEARGLGMALPLGDMLAYERTSGGLRLAATASLRDTATRQDVELEFGASTQVSGYCAHLSPGDPEENGRRWTPMRLLVANANRRPVTLRLEIGYAGEWDVRMPRGQVRVKDGMTIAEIEIDGQTQTAIDWRVRPSRARLKALTDKD